jgi:hypothetical protein
MKKEGAMRRFIKKHVKNQRVRHILRRAKNLPRTAIASPMAILNTYRYKDENPLTQLANRYRSDKGTRKTMGWEGDRHHYTTVYHQYFDKIRLEKLKFLEIGIGGGPSLKIWRNYFPNAEIYAIDIDDFSYLNEKNLTCLQADQSNRDDLKKAMDTIGGVDIIIDDGGHYMNQQQISFGFLFKYVKSGGYYFIEDLHTSYWPYNGFASVYGDIPIDTNADRSNSTLNMIRKYIDTKKIRSDFMTPDEISYLNQHIEDCKLHDTTVNRYGPNHLVVFTKK